MTSSEEPLMHDRRILTQGPENGPLWVRLYVRQVGAMRAAMIVADAKEGAQAKIDRKRED
jgi:hypothetical protein